jgi:transposase InsO family protein
MNLRSVQDAKSGIFELDIFYNRKRRHSANDHLSPVAFEEQSGKAA